MYYLHISEIDEASAYHPELSFPLALLQQHSVTLPVGRTDFSDGVYVNVDEYDTKPVNEKGFEAHRKYIDIQYVVSGKESVRVCPLDKAVCTKEYDEQSDVAFYSASGDDVQEGLLGDGMVAIFYPEDAHEPCLNSPDGPSHVRKMVVKMPVYRTEDYVRHLSEDD